MFYDMNLRCLRKNRAMESGFLKSALGLITLCVV